MLLAATWMGLEPRTEASGETRPSDTLILDFWSPELWEIKALLFNHPVVYFATVTLESKICPLSQPERVLDIVEKIFGIGWHKITEE